MADRPSPPSRRLTVVHAPGCHFCSDAEEALNALAHEFILDVVWLDASEPRGAALVREHRAPMFPLVLLDGALFSFGRLPRGKLRRSLSTEPERAAAPLAGTR